ncbi:E3 ubiquitin-protein ligase RNF166 [Heterodontus francisci]|uniref:E3 ubiquitin-protein ligase RNF166 n=1 Tax=Heterodontus francisci TaxID=7792 RepID=UPI00355C8E7C
MYCSFIFSLPVLKTHSFLSLHLAFLSLFKSLLSVILDGDSHKSSTKHTEDLDQIDSDGDMDFECPVCLQTLERPIKTQCGHVFCQDCHITNFNVNDGKCSLCRAPTSKMEQRATDIEKRMMTKKANCRSCDIEVLLINMRAHTETCSKYLEEYGGPSEASTPPQPTPASHTYMESNRSTYTCPYCQDRNYNEDGLIIHCTTSHFYDPQRVVCPICASMPWGDPNYRSRNFIGHLTLRHQFSYNYFVDDSQDEQTMLQAAILVSYQDFIQIPFQRFQQQFPM